ncbi:MAG: transposase [Phycisphaerales bacterium]
MTHSRQRYERSIGQYLQQRVEESRHRFAGVAQYAGPRQRSARLAHLRRLRADPHQPGAATVCQRGLRRRVGTGDALRLDASTIDPQPLRRIRYIDPDTGKRFVFLTNHFDLPALTIARLYKARWRIELFFKWIKQHLRIQAFYGTSINAVKTQIWIAITTYLLVAILKKELRIEHSLYTMLQVLSVCLFEKTPLLEAFSGPRYTTDIDPFANQLSLFD